MYTTQPKMPEEIGALYETILQALTGALTPTEAAEKLKLSTVQCHNLLNRAAAGVLEALLPKKPGRKSMPEVERRLREENERLKKENQRLQERVDTIDRLMTVAGGILRGQVRTVRRKKKSGEGGGDEPEDPDGAARRRANEAANLREAGLSAAIAAALVGVSSATLRRWWQRLRTGEVLCRRRGPTHSRELSEEKRSQASGLARELRGLCGAMALARAAGVSRRQAARIKAKVVTALERERVARCSTVLVHQPGVMRSLDQLYIGQRPAQRLALLASDAAVAYRTSAKLIPTYTGSEVARVLDDDFAEHGAPLVMRMDRASPHDTTAVHEVLREHEVLLLHGPPRYPQYYGQHERQNREHQGWLVYSRAVDDGELEEMRRALNERWLRPSLGWRSAGTVWAARRELRTNRRELRLDVVRRKAQLSLRLGSNVVAMRRAERLAIEEVLEDRGLIRRIAGGR
jgi:transposase